MKQIWKYTIGDPNKISFEMPMGARVLTVQTQEGIPRIWVEVPDITGKKETREFTLHGTGHDIPARTDKKVEVYVSTFQMYEGREVYHLYELR